MISFVIKQETHGYFRQFWLNHLLFYKRKLPSLHSGVTQFCKTTTEEIVPNHTDSNVITSTIYSYTNKMAICKIGKYNF